MKEYEVVVLIKGEEIKYEDRTGVVGENIEDAKVRAVNFFVSNICKEGDLIEVKNVQEVENEGDLAF